jgi:hypothetical protein
MQDDDGQAVITEYLGPCVWPNDSKKAFHVDCLMRRRYFSLGSGKLDLGVIRETHPRSILAFSKAVGLG